MKANRFFLFTFWLLTAPVMPAQTHSTPYVRAPYIEIVVATDKIWLLPEETPTADIRAEIVDAAHRVVLARTFSTKEEGWSLDISSLPPGQYRLQLSSGQREYFEKRSRKRTL